MTQKTVEEMSNAQRLDYAAALLEKVRAYLFPRPGALEPQQSLELGTTIEKLGEAKLFLSKGQLAKAAELARQAWQEIGTYQTDHANAPATTKNDLSYALGAMNLAADELASMASRGQ